MWLHSIQTMIKRLKKNHKWDNKEFQSFKKARAVTVLRRPCHQFIKDLRRGRAESRTLLAVVGLCASEALNHGITDLVAVRGFRRFYRSATNFLLPILNCLRCNSSRRCRVPKRAGPLRPLSQPLTFRNL